MKDEYDFSKGKRGSVIPIPPHQVKLTILIDKDILDGFREQVEQTGGGDYLALINDALHQHIKQQQTPVKLKN